MSRRHVWKRRRPTDGHLEAITEELFSDPSFLSAIEKRAAEQAMSPDRVRGIAQSYLEEMVASHSEHAVRSWNRLGAWLLRAYDVLVDEEEMVKLRQLDRSHSLAFLFSHRSYLDGWVLPQVLDARRFSPTFTFGGANLDLPGLGPLASRSGVIFIRRDTRDLPVYRLVLRWYIAWLVRRQSNVAWSIEGGRTRTGKLRPPAHGILRYVVDAVEEAPGPDVLVVPVSIVYDQLHEVAGMTAEARGSRKRPEDLRWLASFARSQRNRLGRGYLSIGEVMPLRERVAELGAEGTDDSHAVERVALDVSHRINRVTPVTVTAIVCLALLGADRALTFQRVLDTVEPLARYIDARGWPVAGAASLTDRSNIRRALQELVASGVLTVYEDGTDQVWMIAPDQHLVAAFYRNTTIHIFVGRAIGEVALLAAEDAPDGTAVLTAAWDEALALRALLKFEFFFPSRAGFNTELRDEVAILAHDYGDEWTTADARRILSDARPHLAHLVLRPFMDAYLVVADRLAAAGDDPVDEAGLLDEALRVGKQWELERRIASAESVSLELYRTGLKLAEHRGLLTDEDSEGPSLHERRVAFRDELSRVVAQLATIAEMGRLEATRGAE